jgi:hypothetical protein
MTAADLVTAALQELGVLNAVDPPSGEDGALGLARLNAILDSWNAERLGVYTQVLASFTLTPSLSPHTIGPSGTWVTAQRPVSIESARLVVSGSYSPIAIRDAAWYRRLTVPGQTSAIPTDVYYEEDWPNGKLFFYPIPTAASVVSLESRVVLAALTASDTFTMPPGYQEALTLTLAEHLAAPMRMSLSGDTRRHAEKARARIFSTNAKIPTLCTRDFGMPSGGGSTFDYLTGR